MKEASAVTDDIVTFNDIFNFMARQGKVFAITFIVIFAIGLTYGLSRPTLYKSSTSLTVGENLYFTYTDFKTKGNQRDFRQIESPEEIAYRLEGQATVKPVRNTRLIEVSVIANTAESSNNQLKDISAGIIAEHAKIYQEKRQNFSDLVATLDMGSASKADMLRLFDNASNSSTTKALSPITTQELHHSGVLPKVLAGFFVLALLVASAVAILKDLIERRNIR